MIDSLPMNDKFTDLDPDCNYFNNLYSSVDQQYQSDDYSVEAFNSKFQNKENSNISLINFNIRSFNKNIDNFTAVLNSLCFVPDDIVLTETWLTNDNKIYANIDNYKSFHTIRESGRSGGVSIFYKSCIDVEFVDSLSVCNKTIETCTVKIKLNKEILIIVGIYRPHSDSIENFSFVLNRLLESRYLLKSKVCLAGDFNVNILDDESDANISFVNTLQSLHYMPLITKPTRFPPNDNCEPSLLDGIWINYTDVYTSGIILADITDHCPVFLCIKHDTIDDNYFVKITFRLHSDRNVNEYYNVLNDINWDFSHFDDINVKTSIFLDEINRLYCRYFPLKVKCVSIKRLRKPWLSSAIFNSIKTKSKYFNNV
jgi:hypothetical protein